MPATHDGGWVAWRLVGSNHRELARSAGVFPTAPAAQEGIRLLCNGVERALAVTEAARGLWAWQLSIDEAAVAVASRLYQRPRECAYNLAAALAAIRIADLADLRPMVSGARQREGTAEMHRAGDAAEMDTA